MRKQDNSAFRTCVALILAAASPTTFAQHIQSPSIRLAPNVLYTTTYQNPGAPDQLLLDAPDATSDSITVKISVRNNTVFLQRPGDAIGAPASLAPFRPLRGTDAEPLQLNVNTLPFELFVDSPPVALAECLVDFNDEGALTLSEPSLWFDRIYLPWFQSCDGAGYVDMRPLVMEHFHLGYANPDVVPCFSNDQAYPSIMHEDGSCDYVDVPTEPRTHLTTHTPAEYIWIRVYGNNSQWKNFALNQIHIKGSNSVRLCYRKDEEVDLGWLTSGKQSGTVPGIWLCWSELSPGAWDLSNWVWDVTDVKVTGADGAPGPFSLDSLQFGVQ